MGNFLTRFRSKRAVESQPRETAQQNAEVFKRQPAARLESTTESCRNQEPEDSGNFFCPDISDLDLIDGINMMAHQTSMSNLIDSGFNNVGSEEIPSEDELNLEENESTEEGSSTSSDGDLTITLGLLTPEGGYTSAYLNSVFGDEELHDEIPESSDETTGSLDEESGPKISVIDELRTQPNEEL